MDKFPRRMGNKLAKGERRDKEKFQFYRYRARRHLFYFSEKRKHYRDFIERDGRKNPIEVRVNALKIEHRGIETFMCGTRNTVLTYTLRNVIDCDLHERKRATSGTTPRAILAER